MSEDPAEFLARRVRQEHPLSEFATDEELQRVCEQRGVHVVRRTITDRSGTCIYVADVVYRGDVVKLEIGLSPRPGEPLT